MKKLGEKKGKPSSLSSILPFRRRRLVSHGDGPRPLAPGGPQGADGSDGSGHAGPLRQLGLGQQLPAALQRHGPGLEAVPARGRRRGKRTAQQSLACAARSRRVRLHFRPFGFISSCWQRLATFCRLFNHCRICSLPVASGASRWTDGALA